MRLDTILFTTLRLDTTDGEMRYLIDVGPLIGRLGHHPAHQVEGFGRPCEDVAVVLPSHHIEGVVVERVTTVREHLQNSTCTGYSTAQRRTKQDSKIQHSTAQYKTGQ